MSCNKKISLILLGSEGCQKDLMAHITGKDFSALVKDHPRHFPIYKYKMYQFICTPDLKTRREEIKEIFSENPDPDMCLMGVGETFSPETVWNQIVSLQKVTGRGTEKFIVVLPKRYSPESYPFKFWTRDDVLRELAAYRHAETHSSSDDRSERQMPPQTDKGTGKHAPVNVNLVLLGLSKTGKSATGNTILGRRQFASKMSSKAVTTECKMAETEINGTRVRVIDTPDIFDDDVPQSVRKGHVRTCGELCESAPCVYLLVIHVGRFTDGERGVMKKLEEAFGYNAKEQTVIVFTRGEDLHQDQMSFHEFLERCEPDLRKIVDRCGRRCVLFENNNTHSDQVRKLMEKVDMLRHKI